MIELTREAILTELADIKATIDVAYWSFTRSARGVPPSSAVPEAYARRRVLRERLRALREAESDQPNELESLNKSANRGGLQILKRTRGGDHERALEAAE